MPCGSVRCGKLWRFRSRRWRSRPALSAEEYLAAEDGKSDFTFTFLYNCAQAFGVDIIELLTGEAPHLSFYSIVRKGEGLSHQPPRRLHLQPPGLPLFRKIAEPFLVTAPFSQEEQEKPIHLSQHDGQEFDFVLSGQLKVQMEDHTEYMGPGDAIYYDSGHAHGMIATGGEDCVFLAVVMKDENDKGEND